MTLSLLGGCRLLETVINSGSLSQREPGVEDRKISRPGDLLSEYTGAGGAAGTQRHFEGHTQVEIYRNIIVH